MHNFNETPKENYYQSCLLAAKLAIETISLIIMTLVLLQHRMPDHTRFVLSMVHTLAIITLILSIQMHHMNPIKKPSQTMSNFAKSSHANASPPLPSNVKQDDKAKLTDRRISVSKTNSSSVTSNRYMMRRGCILKPTQRLISQM